MEGDTRDSIRKKMKIYVGWDSREDIAYQVCEHSIKRRDPQAEVYPLKQNEMDALVSWVFNLGPTSLKNSTLLRVLNEGKYHEVPEQIKRWNKVNGKVNEGLVKRRKSEALLFECQDWTNV